MTEGAARDLSKGGRPTVRTPRKRALFLEMLRITGGSIPKAAEMSGLSVSTIYAWRREEPDFDNDVNRAVIESNDYLEAEAVRRGAEGWLEPVIHDGKLCYREIADPEGNIIGREQIFIRRFSDNCLKMALQMRGKLVEKPQQVTVTMTLADMVAASLKPKPIEAPVIDVQADDQPEREELGSTV